MSLAELYNEMYNSEEPEKVAEETKVAEAEKLASVIEDLSDEDAEKLAEACDLLDHNGYQFEDAETKLAAAAEVVDGVENGTIEIEDEEPKDEDDSEKTAAEFDAAGRIMARSFLDEIEKESGDQKKITLKRP